MPVIDRTNTFLAATILLSAMSTVNYAQQWNGPPDLAGRLRRPGYVTVGGEPSTPSDLKAVLDLRLPTEGMDDFLFRAAFSYQDALWEVFAVDRLRAYAGGAKSKASVLPGDYDPAVHQKAAINVANINERIPSGYALAVGGKILAEGWTRPHCPEEGTRGSREGWASWNTCPDDEIVTGVYVYTRWKEFVGLGVRCKNVRSLEMPQVLVKDEVGF
jgi:hypothetical protein